MIYPPVGSVNETILMKIKATLLTTVILIFAGCGSEPEITTDDIVMEYKVYDDTCFGSDGSVVGVSFRPRWRSTEQIKDLQFKITFEIRNTKDGVYRRTFSVLNGEYLDWGADLEFEQCGTLPEIVVTDVDIIKLKYE